jgi:hypothetical protein
MGLTKAFCLVVTVLGIAGCSRSVAHPDAAPGSYYYQMEKTARDMKLERDQRDYEDYKKSQ